MAIENPEEYGIEEGLMIGPNNTASPCSIPCTVWYAIPLPPAVPQNYWDTSTHRVLDR